MQVMKWSVIALAVAAGTSQLAFASAQSESNGFVEDSSLNVLSRNLYFYRDFRNAGPDRNDDPQEWGQGFIATYESGFTQGTIGFGVDAIGLLGIKLDSGKGRAGSGLFPTGSDGRSQDDYSEAGGAVKLRLSNTVLKYGDQFTALPVLSTDDSRLLPEVAEGFLITSNEIEGLELHAGRFTAINAQAQTYHDSLGLKGADVLGGSYSFTDDLSASLYYSDVEDSFKKYYGNANYTFGISEGQSLNFDFNIYKTDYDKEYTSTGKSEDNTIWSLAAAYNFGAHTVTAAYQKSHGGYDGIGYDYGVDGGGTVWLANSVQRSDFNSEDEKSWQLRYDLDFADFGVPGLKFMARYISGSGAKTETTDNGKEWERDIQVGYTVQNGPAKDLNMRVRQATYRSGDGVYYGSPSIDEVRVILEYPLSIL
ncbi:imipenem/basic amino acid-specific outer membrane pore [Pseudomonas sp. NFACC19-2]|jgi:imipenem/basic amino acid-specific outer membrane pore|uniref:Imipenem/basic amino acid-specific outer membrane pore n=1 Tax=Ectopseudomonas toyotomiensis TaxID=554344 RepID=A0A1I5MUB7_9GAMM|nr:MULTISPECIES: OprD family porin [Pseudomonas]ERH53523.1 membrane protein [Pseudomonas chengduensis]PIA74899.1 outer membrane porin, OprD family [Pseudomonas toyotomiensis]WKC35585.1 OprD family porin [Pseudomonas chengduensis]SDA54501.1 imipenem/basic amino acid-specific outer membrane pore [Pseudomonas sp. NFPP33]SFP13125.1 imipenem/basic amino acid-specific outer membrane pore [Pseudomonas toyotomiensis]